MSLFFLTISTIFASGCGGDDTETNPPPPVLDSGKDVKVDTGTDAGKDTGIVTPDAKNDGDAVATTDGDATAPTPDADAGNTPDVKADVTPDVGSDVKADVTPDVGSDVKADVTPDAKPDVSPDATPDVTPVPDATPDVAPVTLTSISLSPENGSIVQLKTQQFTATGHYSDGSTANVTGSVTWASSQQSIATISTGGLATATNATGTTSISATIGTVATSTNLTVAAATVVSIALAPSNTTILPTTTEQFTAIAVYNNGSTQDVTATATWSSTNNNVATVNATGLALGVQSGTTDIGATFQGIGAAIPLKVQAVNIIAITVTPGSPSIPKGLTQQFKAVATFDDASTQDITSSATWESSATATATIDGAGLATSTQTSTPGTTVITATKGGTSGVANLEIRDKELVQIVVDPAQASIADGTKTNFTAKGIFTDSSNADLTIQAAWDTSDHSVATVSSGPNDGEATAVDPGDVAVSATYLGVTGSAVLHVTQATLAQIQIIPPNPSIAKGTTVGFTATGVYTDGHNQDITTGVVWTTSDGNLATIAADGTATGKGVGDVTVTATQGAITKSATLHVTSATLVSLAISSPVTSIPNGLKVQFQAIGTYTDTSTQDLTNDPTLTWSSTMATVASISAAGLATADNLGDTTISAKVGIIPSNNIVLHVTDAVLQTITVTPGTFTTPKGTSKQFTASGLYSDGTNVDVTTTATWTSATTDNVTIGTSTGLAKGVNVGSSVITAAMPGPSGTVSGTATLTVSNAVLSSITVAPSTVCIANGSTQQFVATGHFTDSTTVILTSVATWTSSVTAVATISNVNPTHGVSTAGTVASGTADTTIKAAYDPGTGLVEGTATLTVGACP